MICIASASGRCLVLTTVIRFCLTESCGMTGLPVFSLINMKSCSAGASRKEMESRSSGDGRVAADWVLGLEVGAASAALHVQTTKAHKRSNRAKVLDFMC